MEDADYHPAFHCQDSAASAYELGAHSEIVAASYNVHKCVGLDRRFDPDRTMQVISEINVDVIALQEVDQRFGDRVVLLNLDVVEREIGLVPLLLAGYRKSHGRHGNVVLSSRGFSGLSQAACTTGRGTARSRYR